MSHVRCKWIPGTFTGVTVMTPDRTFDIDVQKIQRLLGDEAVWNLYLKGQFQHDIPDETVEKLVEARAIWPQSSDAPVGCPA